MTPRDLRHRLRPATATLLAATLACSSRARTEDSGAFHPLQPGEVVPAYVALTTTGDTIRVGPREPVTLLNIWATWCIPCRKEFPELERLHRTLGPRGLRVVAVSVDRTGRAVVEDFARAQGATFAIALDPRGDIEARYATIGLPNTFLIGGDGRLRKSWIGPLPPAARNDISAALAGTLPAR